MSAKVIQLMDWYAKITDPSTGDSVKNQLMSRVYEKIEEGKRKLGLDIILRLPDGTRCTEMNVGVMSLFKQYKETLKDESGSYDITKRKEKEKDPNSLIFLELKLLACGVGEPTEILFSIWNKETAF